jgi:pyruvate/2-oxoglutarate dehydrogenase complex dihydrolipoamide dehydrogenase (E3) component
VPNSDRLDVAAAGTETDEHGHVRTDGTYQTNVPGIWALGDLANHFQLKHMANAETRLVGYRAIRTSHGEGRSPWCRRRCSPARRSPRWA